MNVLRITLIGGFLSVAAVILWVSFIFGVETSTGTLLINLGTEIVGIVITVAVVEWFFERRRLQTRGRQLAWDALHAVEHAVWVWQGGPREMDTDEVRGILNSVGGRTRCRTSRKGSSSTSARGPGACSTTTRTRSTAVPGFMNGLEHLARLSAIRDGRTRCGRRRWRTSGRGYVGAGQGAGQADGAPPRVAHPLSRPVGGEPGAPALRRRRAHDEPPYVGAARADRVTRRARVPSEPPVAF